MSYRNWKLILRHACLNDTETPGREREIPESPLHLHLNQSYLRARCCVQCRYIVEREMLVPYVSRTPWRIRPLARFLATHATRVRFAEWINKLVYERQGCRRKSLLERRINAVIPVSYAAMSRGEQLERAWRTPGERERDDESAGHERVTGFDSRKIKELSRAKWRDAGITRRTDRTNQDMNR